MTSLMPRSFPCRRCRTVLVKTGGITGMCRACREADPVMAQEQREAHAAMKVGMADWLKTNFEDVPGRPGLMKPKKGFDPFK
jgi:hypothetical protein